MKKKIDVVEALAVFILKDEQIICTDTSSDICPSDVNLCRPVVDLFLSRGKSSGKIVFSDGQLSDDLFVEKFVCPVCTSNDLFV